MIKQLHPTLKACKCGYIGSRAELYKHFDIVQAYFKEHGHEKEFSTLHGESVLNIDDPRIDERIHS